MEQRKAEDLVRRLAAALRGSELYSPTHPLVQRGIDVLTSDALDALREAPSVVIGFIGNEVVVDGGRLPRGSAALASFARDLREREIEKVTLTRGLTREEVRAFVTALGDRESRRTLADRLTMDGVHHIKVGKIVVEDVTDDQVGIAAARRVYATAVETAETLWQTAKAGDKPDPDAARTIVDGL